jgi:hypothetical protein
VLGSAKFSLLVFAVLLGGAKASASPQAFHLEWEPIESAQSVVLIATHLTSEFDDRRSSRIGAERAIAKAKLAAAELIYLKTSPENPDDLKAASSGLSRAAIAQHYSNFLANRAPRDFFPQQIVPSEWVWSWSGRFSLQDQAMTDVVLVGGYFEACMSESMRSLLDTFATMPQKDLIIHVIVDGTYTLWLDSSSQTKSGQVLPVTLATFSNEAPESFDRFISSHLGSIFENYSGITYSTNLTQAPSGFDSAAKRVFFQFETSQQLNLPAR